jgi:predicted Zn finger-like uncharacterized protein
MFTFCPDCATVFTVKADHLHAAGGLVRCGSCNHVYSAMNYLFEEVGVARDAAAAHQASRELAKATDADTEDGSLLVWEMAADDIGAPDPVVTRADERPYAAASPIARPMPGGWQQQSIAWRDVVSGAGIGLLILLLGAQWLYFNRNALANDARWRPIMERFCAFLPCDLPLQADLAQIELLERDVRKHPRADAALLINATLANHASHVQPYPVFSVSFANLSGKPVALRHFRPAEYLGDNTVISAGMAPGSRVHAVLEITDPGTEAVSFQLDFL